MEREGLTFDRICADAIDQFEGVKVHVVGDTIVDSYTHMRADRRHDQDADHERALRASGCDFVGGAGIVAKHLRAGGRRRDVLDRARQRRAGANSCSRIWRPRASKSCAIIDRTRPTTHKNAIIAGGYRLLKIDTLDNRSISDKHPGETWRSKSAESPADIVVFSDFRHGIFNRDTIPALIEAIPPTAFRVADSQVASRWGNILEFRAST